MPSSQLACRPQLESVKSRLGQSLVRLHKNMEETRIEEMLVDNLFSSWNEAWSSRRERISRRLEIIESRLDKLAKCSQPTPRLAIVAEYGGRDEMTT